ncbi:glycosyltransferase family 4 protein [Micromonospora sp. NPDC002389]|uniref:glycosyltransferase family 4 protein n=1 Tax=Micromonospora sp. NPDC002389 TaxID=3154272 RepID=UPI0033193D07
MESVAGDVPRPSRGRVVMLVDNDVRGDSRVQKIARSAAAAGWEVILLGERRDAPVESWQLGEAEVRLVELNSDLAMPPTTFTRSLLRRPLAYPPGRMANYRLGIARARRADVRMRIATLRARRADGGSRLREVAGLGLLAAPWAAAKAMHRWARFRARETNRLKAARRDERALLNTIPISFWKAVLGRRAWRRLDPGLWRWELSFGRVIDRLKPDIIHAHDFRMIGVGARATMRARASGRRVKLVWDAHEYAPGLRPRPNTPRWLPAVVAHEKEYAPYADAVVTVSSSLAELLRTEHKLPVLPDVVMNAPVSGAPEETDSTPVPDLRTLCGVGSETPLLAYCGGITPVRGVNVMIDALPDLPGVHIALVSLHPNGKNATSDEAFARAEDLGVADRVHLLPYVPHWQVAQFLAPADAAVSPLVHLSNHEIALSNKFFEYSQARLPLITSDVRTMAEMVRSTGQGEVFRAEDVTDYVRAVKTVLADPERYRAAYDRPGLLEGWTWEAQAAVLDRVYTGLLRDRAGASPAVPAGKPTAVPATQVATPSDSNRQAEVGSRR